MRRRRARRSARRATPRGRPPPPSTPAARGSRRRPALTGMKRFTGWGTSPTSIPRSRRHTARFVAQLRWSEAPSWRYRSGSQAGTSRSWAPSSGSSSSVRIGRRRFETKAWPTRGNSDQLCARVCAALSRSEGSSASNAKTSATWPPATFSITTADPASTRTARPSPPGTTTCTLTSRPQCREWQPRTAGRASD